MPWLAARSASAATSRLPRPCFCHPSATTIARSASDLPCVRAYCATPTISPFSTAAIATRSRRSTLRMAATNCSGREMGLKNRRWIDSLERRPNSRATGAPSDGSSATSPGRCAFADSIWIKIPPEKEIARSVVPSQEYPTGRANISAQHGTGSHHRPSPAAWDAHQAGDPAPCRQGRLGRGPGGCFFWAVAEEYDSRRPGPVRDSVLEKKAYWSYTLQRAVREAQQAGEIDAGVDPEQLAWELDSLMGGANGGFKSGEGSRALERGRRAIRERLTRAATAAASPNTSPPSGEVSA